MATAEQRKTVTSAVTSEQVRLVEKPPHIDEQRMRHISDADLFAALDLSRPELAEVRSAVDRGDWPDAYQAWGRYFAVRTHPVPISHVHNYASFLNTNDPARAKAIVDAAEQLWTENIDFTDRSKGKSGLYGFHYMQWLEPLTDAYAITGDERHVAAFVRLFNQWYETRDDVHGEWPMDVIWYSLGLSIRTPRFARAYHTFRNSDAIDTTTQARLLKTFLGAARWLAEEHDTFRYGNWQHHGVTGLFEIATFWPEFSESSAWAELAWERLLDHLELDVYADGGHLERAPSYHSGVLDGYHKVALAAELNWHKRLQDTPRFREMYRWLMAHCTPQGVSTTFNDSGPVWVGPHMVRGAVLFDDPEMKWLAMQLGTPEEIGRTLSVLPDPPNGRSAAATFDALPATAPANESVLQTTSKFAIMRSGWDADDLFLAISYGPHVGHELESHSHLDPLSFTCAGRGRFLAVEAGCPRSYDDPLYYDWYQAARSHNVVTVDEENPLPEQKDAELRLWSSTPVADVFQGEHDGYLATKGVRHRRTILFVRDDYWITHDELMHTQARRFDWHLYTPNAIKLEDGVVKPVSEPGLLVHPVLRDASEQIEFVRGTMSIPGPRAYEGTHDWCDTKGVRITRRADGPRTVYLNLLCPVSSDADAAEIIAESVDLQGGAGEACFIQTGCSRDLLVIGTGEGGVMRQAESWASDASVWLVRLIGSWSMWNGGQMSHDGSQIFAASVPVDAAAVWSTGEGIAADVTTNRRTVVQLQAPGDWQRIIVNGVSVPTMNSDRDPSILLPAAGRYDIRIEST